MRRVAVISLLIILVLPQVPTTNALQSLYIQPGEYETWTWRTTYYMGLYGHFDVVNGTDITFFICNETAFNEWIDGHDIVKYELKEDVTSSDYEFLSHGVSPPPRRSAIRWYLVFDNTDSPSTAQTVNVDFQTDQTPPTIECNVNEDDVLSDIWEFNVTGVDRFGIDSIECTIYASSYPNSFGPVRFSFEGNSSTFSLDTTLMKNGSYCITIKATDASTNEQQKTIHFSVENAPSDILGLPTIPLIVIGTLLGIAMLVVVYGKRRNPPHAPAKEEGEIS